MILDIKSIEEKEQTREIVHQLIGSKKQIEKDMIADFMALANSYREHK